MDSRIAGFGGCPEAGRHFCTGISLHSHTSHSRENLGFLHDHAVRAPLLRWLLKRKERLAVRAGIQLDFKRAYWTPPLSAREAYVLEASQIWKSLDLNALVSLTDHDNIEAPILLRILSDTSDVPVSLEWTVPFRRTEFHLGVHNLPAHRAEEYVRVMNVITGDPDEELLDAMLCRLHSHPEVLVVLNHPLWDLQNVGEKRHLCLLHAFLRLHRERLHALELGGLRSWGENVRTMELAAMWELAAISGGDRHGSEPNAVINLTDAKTFPEFISEIRDGHSRILFMPQYGRPMAMRYIQIAVDVVRDCPGHSLGDHWTNRTFHPDRSGETRPLSALWRREPAFLKAIFSTLRIAESRPLRWAADSILNRSGAQMRLTMQSEEGI